MHFVVSKSLHPLKCNQLSEPSDQQETLFDFPIAKVGQNEKVDTIYVESASLQITNTNFKKSKRQFSKTFSVPSCKVYCWTLLQIFFPFDTSIRCPDMCANICVVTKMCKIWPRLWPSGKTTVKISFQMIIQENFTKAKVPWHCNLNTFWSVKDRGCQTLIMLWINSGVKSFTAF